MVSCPTGALTNRKVLDVDLPHGDEMSADELKALPIFARMSGTFLELNAHPERLDLFDTHCRMAKDEGALVSVNSDAHSVQQFDNLKYGVGQARRGWLEKENVANTRTLPELRALLAARAPRSKAGAAA